MDPLGKQEESEMFRSQTHLYKHIFNFISSMSLKCAIQLGIPEIIHKHGDKPVSLTCLVSELNLHSSKSSSIRRLMRILIHSGLFSKSTLKKSAINQISDKEDEEEEDAYSLTSCSRLLLKDNPNCLSPFLSAMLEPALVTPWHVLSDWFIQEDDLTTTTPFANSHGVDLWGFMNQNVEFKKKFNEAMVSDSQMMNLVIKDCRTVFEEMNSLVDVGGGTGGIAKIIAEEFPLMKCTVLDLPHVVADLESNGNLYFIGGDMFQNIPSADCLLLKLVLHAFDERVLKKCREAIPSNGKVIIIDIVINEKGEEDEELAEAKLFFDMLMMVVVKGRERTEKEWGNMFLEAGFKRHKITHILGLRSLIEVYP